MCLHLGPLGFCRPPGVAWAWHGCWSLKETLGSGSPLLTLPIDKKQLAALGGEGYQVPEMDRHCPWLVPDLQGSAVPPWLSGCGGTFCPR